MKNDGGFMLLFIVSLMVIAVSLLMAVILRFFAAISDAVGWLYRRFTKRRRPAR
jgi:uncharacterized membrane protein